MIKVIFSLLQLFVFSPLLISSNTTAANQPQITTTQAPTEFQQLKKAAPSIKPKVLKMALSAFDTALKEGQVKKSILTVIDYSLPSSQQRMWVFNLKNDHLLFNTFVAHGKNSGNKYAKNFSNIPSSRATSLGTFVTKNTYIGSKGYSLNLKGLDKGFNDNAYARRIVMHGASYMSPAFIKQVGRAGRSWGCPAVSTTLAKPIINTIKDGSVIFAYYPEQHWLHQSHYV